MRINLSPEIGPGWEVAPEFGEEYSTVNSDYAYYYTKKKVKLPIEKKKQPSVIYESVDTEDLTDSLAKLQLRARANGIK